VGWQIMSKLGKKVRDLAETKQQPLKIRENTTVSVAFVFKYYPLHQSRLMNL